MTPAEIMAWNRQHVQSAFPDAYCIQHINEKGSSTFCVVTDSGNTGQTIGAGKTEADAWAMAQERWRK